MNIMKLIIASTHCTKINLIEYQYKSIKKFILDKEYEYIVFNDGTNDKNIYNFYRENTRDNIENKCKELNIKCINIPSEIHSDRTILFPKTKEKTINPCTRCANVTQYAFNYLKNENAILLFIDADMFFVNYIDIEKYLGNYHFRFCEQSRNNKTNKIHYMWNGIYIMNLEKTQNKDLINFDCGKIDGLSVDVGGHTYKFLYKTDKNNYSHVGYSYISNMDTVNDILFNHGNIITKETIVMLKNIQEFYENKSINGEFFLNFCVYHIRGFGGNWDYENMFFNNYIIKQLKSPCKNSEEKGILWGKYNNELLKIFEKYIENI